MTGSSLRERHATHTRSAIIRAFARLVSSKGPTSFSLQEVADQAGVSIRTLHRHFGSRDDLWQGLRDEAETGTDFPEPTEATWDDFRGSLTRNFEKFSSDEELIRALVLARFNGIPDDASRSRTEWTRALVDRGDPSLDEVGRRQLTGLIRLLAGSIAWARLTDKELGLLPGEAGDASEWAVQVLFEAAAKCEGRLEPSGSEGA